MKTVSKEHTTICISLFMQLVEHAFLFIIIPVTSSVAAPLCFNATYAIWANDYVFEINEVTQSIVITILKCNDPSYTF